MAKIRRDSIGRIIPDYDRSESRTKAAKTRLARNPDTFKEMAKKSLETRPKRAGWFSVLKDEGYNEQLNNIAKKGGLATRKRWKELNDNQKESLEPEVDY